MNRAAWLALWVGWGGGAWAAGDGGLLTNEFIFTSAPFDACHASTLVDAEGGLAAAWFGGSAEGKPDVGIWVARRGADGWSAPAEVANGVQSPTIRHPCWNPVLFQPRAGPLLLFYKVGPNPKTWWGMIMTSTNGGRSWSDPRRLPDGIAGPIKNKPLELDNGDLLCPSSTEDSGWRIHMERTADGGLTWTRTEPLIDGVTIGAIQPALLRHPGGRLQALGRTRQGRIFSTWSADAGRSWSPLALLDLPNPNSGIDAVTLRDGRHLLVYNHTPKGRTPLNVACSTNGTHWAPLVTLEQEAGEFSYPAIIQSADGLVHITYTWKRTRIRHAVIDVALPARAASDLRVDVQPGGWGDAGVPDVRAVVRSAGREIQRYCSGVPLPPLIVRHGDDSPITLFQHDAQGRVVVDLNVEGRHWAQLAFQFAHEFGHVLAGHAIDGRPRVLSTDRANHWLEESLCEAASLFALRAMARSWPADPPYPNWRDYAPHLASYAADRLQEFAAAGPADGDFPAWFRREEPSLRTNACQRVKNGVIAAMLLPLLEAQPSRWAALAGLNASEGPSSSSLADFLAAWRRAVGPADRPFVDQVGTCFGLADADLLRERGAAAANKPETGETP